MRENDISGMTGDVCEVSGTYSCVAMGHGQIVMIKGALFPNCPSCKHDTVWWLRERV